MDKVPIKVKVEGGAASQGPECLRIWCEVLGPADWGPCVPYPIGPEVSPLSPDVKVEICVVLDVIARAWVGACRAVLKHFFLEGQP